MDLYWELFWVRVLAVAVFAIILIAVMLVASKNDPRFK